MKKPKCPICEAKISLHTWTATGTSTSSSGHHFNGKSMRYKCASYRDICRVSENMYNAANGCSIFTKKQWPDALAKYIGFCEFCEDNNLKYRMAANSNECGELSKSSLMFFTSIILDIANKEIIDQAEASIIAKEKAGRR